MKTSVGKYSYPVARRIEIFRFALSEVRKRFDGPVALCKETLDVWQAVGLDPRRCACVCQFEEADLLRRNADNPQSSPDDQALVKTENGRRA